MFYFQKSVCLRDRGLKLQDILVLVKLFLNWYI